MNKPISYKELDRHIDRGLGLIGIPIGLVYLVCGFIGITCKGNIASGTFLCSMAFFIFYFARLFLKNGRLINGK